MTDERLTPEQVDHAFVALLAMNARMADQAVVAMLGGTRDVLAEYIWDHWLCKPEDISVGQVRSDIDKALA